MEDLELTPSLEEQYRNHKVVAFPNSRGRSSVREMAAANNNKVASQQNLTSKTTNNNSNSQSPPQRPRSLSAGRPRNRPNDLVQDVYDRMGVNFRKGQGSDVIRGSSSEEMQPSPTSRMASPVMSREVMSLTSPEGGPFDGGNFQERYRNAVRGRSDKPTTESDGGTIEPRRTRSLSRGRQQLAKRWPPSSTSKPSEETETALSRCSSPKPMTPPKRSVTAHPSSPKRVVEPSPSWTEDPGEEKKEDHADPRNTTPSIKERINSYGKPGAKYPKQQSTTNNTNGTGMRRLVDPAYATQFATRDHPPKIDIYEGKKDETDSFLIPEPVVSPVAPEDEQRQPPTSPRNNKTSTPLAVFGPGKKGGNLANAFLTAINSKAPVTGSTSSFKSPSNNSTGAPLSEIAVGETGDMGANDMNSVTGLSTVSGEEFSAGPSRGNKANGGGESGNNNKRGSWQNGERNRVSTFRSTSAVTHKRTGSNNGTSMAFSNSVTNTGASGTAEVERLVEERVQARVADLEARIEQKLRTLVGQMEDKIMHRLDTLELKMTAAVAKKK